MSNLTSKLVEINQQQGTPHQRGIRTQVKGLIGFLHPHGYAIERKSLKVIGDSRMIVGASINLLMNGA